MTPYERGYAAGLKAAAKAVGETTPYSSSEKRLLEDLYDEILSLPIEGEATNPGEQMAYSARNGSKHLPEVSFDLTSARSGPYVVVPRTEFMREIGSKPFEAWTIADIQRVWLIALGMDGELSTAKEEHDAHR